MESDVLSELEILIKKKITLSVMWIGKLIKTKVNI